MPTFMGVTEFPFDKYNPDGAGLLLQLEPKNYKVIVFYYAVAVKLWPCRIRNIFITGAYTAGRSQPIHCLSESGWEFLSMNRTSSVERRHYYDLGVNINETW